MQPFSFVAGWFVAFFGFVAMFVCGYCGSVAIWGSWYFDIYFL